MEAQSTAAPRTARSRRQELDLPVLVSVRLVVNARPPSRRAVYSGPLARFGPEALDIDNVDSGVVDGDELIAFEFLEDLVQ